MNLLKALPSSSIDLVVTSPPFDLTTQKDYGNKTGREYLDWLHRWAIQVKRVIKNTGSFVIDLGGAYLRGVPVRSLYNYRVLLELCDHLEFFLAGEFFWHNPSKLPSPAEWVTVRKIRVKDQINTVWWLSKTEWPKADTKKVLVEYSERMKKLLQDPEASYSAAKRPSGHNVTMGFGSDNGGSLPSNLLTIPNSGSNSQYLRYCKLGGVRAHSARFPADLPKFFIKFLTDPGDVVLDIFAGSNTTGEVAEELGRRWIAFELNREFLKASALRFLGKLPIKIGEDIY